MSGNWVQKRKKDFFHRKAKEEGFRSRAAYKLIQVNQSHNIIKPGNTVLDLGSGGGIDVFLAAKKVGAKGKVIGVDMTEDMVNRSKDLARKYGYDNVEFKLGEIEKLPIEDGSIDVIISNCVINLAPDKQKVFNEAYRVLRPGGRLMVSDIVLEVPLSKEMRDEVAN